MTALNITHTLRYHQSAFSAAAECAQIPDGAILGEWLADNVSGFDPENLNVSYSIGLTEPVHSDVAAVYAPQAIGGVAIGTILYWAGVAAVVIGLVYALTLGKPKANKAGKAGDDMDLSSVVGNQVRFGDTARELFGQYKIYPDYITPPHRYFENKTDHWSEFLLSVGVGEYDVPLSEVRIGDTPVAAYGAGASIKVFQPGELIDNDTKDWWHTVPEVGGTRNGSSGLPLRPSYVATAEAQTGNKSFSGTTITSLDEPFPSDWTAGLKLQIEYRRSFSVSGNRITGPLSGIVLEPGDSVDLDGDLTGTYIVDTVQPSSAPTTGTPSVLTGNSSFSLNYKSPANSAAVFQVTLGRLSSTYTLNDDYANAAALVAELNAQVSASALSDLIVFSSDSGKLKITEEPEYGGSQISIIDISNAVTLFGDIALTNSASIIGVAAGYSTPSSFTLLNFSQANQSALLSIKKTGDYFELVGNSDSFITVQRRTADDALDWIGFDDPFTLSDTVIRLDDSAVEIGWQGWFDVQPQNEKSTAIEVDVFFPQGLFNTDKKGRPYGSLCPVTMQWRENGSAVINEQSINYYEARLDQMGFTQRINVPAGRWQFRIRRNNAEYSGTNGTNKAEIFGLRSKIVGAPLSYPLFTTLSVKIKGSEAASAEADGMISCVATRKLNGVPTRSISDAVKYITRGHGLDDGRLAQLQTIWDSRGDTFDFSYEKEHTIKQAVNIALGAGMGLMIIRDGLITPIREAKRNPLLRAHSFSAQNTTKPIMREISLIDGDETLGIDVEYLSSETWRVETVKCRKAGLTGSKVEKIKADGITSRVRAWRLGMRELMRKRYQRQTISTSTELDALNCNYNDLSAFIEDVPQYGQSALVVSSDNATVRTTEPIQWVAGAQMVAVARDDKGQLGAMADITRVDDYSFAPSASMGDLKPMQTIFIGNRDRIITSGIVIDVKPSNNGAKITAVNYTDRIYDFDDAQADN